VSGCSVSAVVTATRSVPRRHQRVSLIVSVVALGSLAVLGSGCGGSTTASGGATTSTASSSAAAGDTTAVCALVRSDLAMVGTSSTLPIDDGQRLLASAQGSGDHALTTEALALASASHTLDAHGVAHALQQMSDTCRSIGH
jgi:hypothetical protein